MGWKEDMATNNTAIWLLSTLSLAGDFELLLTDSPEVLVPGLPHPPLFLIGERAIYCSAPHSHNADYVCYAL